MTNFEKPEQQKKGEHPIMKNLNTIVTTIAAAILLWFGKTVSDLTVSVQSLRDTMQERVNNVIVNQGKMEAKQDYEGNKIFNLESRISVMESVMSSQKR